MFSIKRLKNHDYIITICIFLLSIFSLALIFSTTYTSTDLQSGAGTFKKQIVFFIVGYIIYFALANFDISWLKNLRILAIIYLVTIGLLIYVKFFTPEVASTNRWIIIFGYGIQPAEYAKIVLTIVIASIFSEETAPFLQSLKFGKKTPKPALMGKRKKLTGKVGSKMVSKIISLKKFIIAVLISIPVIGLVFIQPAFGNSIIIVWLIASILFAASNNQLKIVNFLVPLFIIPLIEWHVIDIKLSIMIPVIIALFVLMIALSLKSKLKWYLIIASFLVAFTIKPAAMTIWESKVLSPYQKERFQTFFQSPESDPLKAGYQVRQSKIAIGAGRLFGRGYLKGTQSTLKVLPFAHTDFIFASLGEQFGLVGASLLITIYLILLIRIIISAQDAKDEFNFLITIGCCVIIVLNIFINIGMNLGKLPVTGVPLPLVSYGGSSVIVNLTGLGLIQAARRHINIKDVSESLTPNHSPWM